MLDIIFEFVLEVILEGTVSGIMYLLQKIIPEEKISPRFEKAVKVVLAIVSGIMAVMLFLGIVIRIFAESPEDKSMANTLLIISGSFIALLVIIRIFTPKKTKEE